jgi:two-component system response regulator YesN
MYKVLLVDDERIIREGIRDAINWGEHGLFCVGAVSNGIDAYEMITKDPPDIVITDIKMPILSGLELIEMVKKKYPEIKFVVLSGYSEFELANKAMRYGVKHYLLKPINEQKLIEVLEEIKDEIVQVKEKEDFIKRNSEKLKKVMPLVKEQFIRDFITNKNYTNEEFDYYKKLLNIDEEEVRMLMLHLEGSFGFEEMISLRNISIDIFGEENVSFNLIFRDQVIFLIRDIDENKMMDLINLIKKNFSSYYGMEFTTAYSNSYSFDNAPLMYKEVQECLEHKFYLGEGSIITKKDIEFRSDLRQDNITFDFEKIAMAVKGGNIHNVNIEIDKVFSKLSDIRCEINIARTYCTELLMTIIRHCESDRMNSYIKKAIKIQEVIELDQINEFIKGIAYEITNSNFAGIKTRHSKLVQNIIEHVEGNIGNEDLSLKWIANELMFTNVGYLSRLFNKEMSENFPHYVMRLRMEKAQQLIQVSEVEKIYEVAEIVGWGSNPQYFSQLFKKYTGYSPKEYKRMVDNKYS